MNTFPYDCYCSMKVVPEHFEKRDVEVIMPPERLPALAEYDTATICNIIELFEVRPDSSGFMDGRIRSAFPELPPMVGYASTVSFRSAAPPDSGSIYSDLETQLDQLSAAGPSIVVF